MCVCVRRARINPRVCTIYPLTLISRYFIDAMKSLWIRGRRIKWNRFRWEGISDTIIHFTTALLRPKMATEIVQVRFSENSSTINKLCRTVPSALRCTMDSAAHILHTVAIAATHTVSATAAAANGKKIEKNANAADSKLLFVLLYAYLFSKQN